MSPGGQEASHEMRRIFSPHDRYRPAAARRRNAMRLRLVALALAVVLVLGLAAAGPAPVPAQTRLVMAFVPSGEAPTIVASGNRISHLLEMATGYQFQTFVATSYAGVIEAMGANRAD